MGAHRFNPNARGGLRLRDQLGRDLQVGDEVQVPALVSPRYRVVDVTPALEPGAPDGAIRVVLVAQVALYVDGRQPAEQLLRVRTAAEIAAPGAAPPAAALASDRVDEHGRREPSSD